MSARAFGFVAALCAAALLAGCGTPTGTTADSPSPSPSRSATLAPSPTPTPAADVLFTISARVRGTDGSVIGIRMTAHSPVAARDAAAASTLSTEFLEQCGHVPGGPSVTHDSMIANGATLMGLELTSDPDGKDFASPVTLYFGSPFFGRSAKGDGIEHPGQAGGCFGEWTDIWTSSGTAHGIAEFESETAGSDLGKWRAGLYGFSVVAGTDSTLEGCTIELTPLAEAAKPGDLGGWETSDTSGTSCATGYVGE